MWKYFTSYLVYVSLSEIQSYSRPYTTISRDSAWRSSTDTSIRCESAQNINKSCNEWKDKIEKQPKTTAQEREDDTEEPIKRTDLVKRDSASLYSHRKTFSSDFDMELRTARSLEITKGLIPKNAAHGTVHDTKV